MKTIVEPNKREETDTMFRQSGLELLRIFAACGVVMLHYNDGLAFEYVKDGGFNQGILYFLESLCICAVDLFVLISSFFLCKTNKRLFCKPFALILQVILFKECFYIASVLFFDEVFSIKEFIIKLIPNNYFVILYTILYFVSPYINLVFEKLSYKEWKKFIATLVVAFSLWPTLVDLIEEMTGIEFFGLSSIGAWGSQQGFNIVNFMLIYCIAAFVRYNSIPSWFIKKKSNIVMYILISTLIIFGWSYINRFMVLDGLRSAWVYHNPVVIALSVFLFIGFYNMSFSNRVINELAKASFTCFLMHQYFLRLVKIDLFVNKPFYLMLLHILVCITIIYCCSWLVHVIYHKTLKIITQFILLFRKIWQKNNRS